MFQFLTNLKVNLMLYLIIKLSFKYNIKSVKLENGLVIEYSYYSFTLSYKTERLLYLPVYRKNNELPSCFYNIQTGNFPEVFYKFLLESYKLLNQHLTKEKDEKYNKLKNLLKYK